MHDQHEDVLRYVQQAPDDLSWTIDQAEFDDLLALKKETAPALTEFLTVPTGVLVAWVRSSSLMQIELSWKGAPSLTSYIDDHGRIIRSPDTLRPLTLCNCDCKPLYFCHVSRPSLVHCAMQSPLTEMHPDFAAAYPNVNHTWIFSVLENTGLLDFLCRFLRSI